MTDDELKRLFHSMREENTAAHVETRRQVAETANRISAESRDQFEIVFKRFNNRFDILAEAIRALDEKLDLRTAALEERMERGFAETQALIKSFTPNWSEA